MTDPIPAVICRAADQQTFGKRVRIPKEKTNFKEEFSNENQPQHPGVSCIP